MNNKEIKPGTIIGNVNILDLTKATEQTIASIRRIRNVNVLLYSKENAHLIPKLAIDNMNTSVQLENTPKITTGQLVISKESVQEVNEPLDHVVIGQMLIEPDVISADIERMFASLVMVGQLMCPEPAMAALKAKAKQMVGQQVSYPADARLITGGVTLNEILLSGLEDNTVLMVVGSLRVPEVLPAELFERKIKRLHVIGNARCPEENAAMIRAKLADGTGKMDVVPTGYVLVEKPLVVDNAILDVLPGKKLYCLRGVQIETGIDPARFDDRIERLISKQAVLCPEELRSVLAKKCDLLKTRAVFYEGTLWLISGEEKLSTSRFEYLEGKATLVVQGMLKIDDDVEPRILAERLDKVYNFGMIECTKEQRGALESKLGVNEGMISDSAGDKDENTIGNVNLLTL
jgi:hypothetical protein